MTDSLMRMQEIRCIAGKIRLDLWRSAPARRNNWGYNQTLGLGYYEYFQLAERI